MSETPAIPALRPADDPVSAPYWAGLREGRLRFQRCRRCGTSWLPPRPECWSCLAPDAEWAEASGRGRLVSWVVFHHAYHPAFAADVPYPVGLVALDEGPRLLSRLVGVDDPEKLDIDQPLRLAVRERDGVALPCFAPAEGP